MQRLVLNQALSSTKREKKRHSFKWTVTSWYLAEKAEYPGFPLDRTCMFICGRNTKQNVQVWDLFSQEQLASVEIDPYLMEQCE